MKISVIGAGGVGSAIAAYLAHAGHDVTLVYKDHEDAQFVRAHGLNVFGKRNFRAQVRVLEWPAPIPASDVFVAAVKTFDTEEALSVAQGADIGVAISAQNGIDKETTIRRVLGKDKVVGAVIQITAENQGRGQIFHPGITPSYVGELDGGLTDRCGHLARMLSEASIPTEATGNLHSIEWTKTCMWVATSVLSVMTGQSFAFLFASPWLTPILVEIVRECANVARKDGAEIVEVAGLFVRDLLAMENQEAYSLMHEAGKRYHGRWKNYRSSMLLDVERGSKTEFHDVVGYVHRKAREYGVETPALDFAVRQVSRYLPVPASPAGSELPVLSARSREKTEVSSHS